MNNQLQIISQSLSQNYHQQTPKLQSFLPNNYYQIQQSNHSQLYSQQHQPSYEPQQTHKITRKQRFKMVLPKIQDQQDQIQGNIGAQPKRPIMIKHQQAQAKQEKKNKQIQIFDLQNEKQQEAIENIQLFDTNKRKPKRFLQKKDRIINNQNDDFQIQSNQFNQPVKKQQIQQVKQITKQQIQQKEQHIHINKISKKIIINEPSNKQDTNKIQINRNVIKQDQDHMYFSPPLKIQSSVLLTNSRQQTSTRSIIPSFLQQSKNRKKLPPLKPLKDVLGQQQFQIVEVGTRQQLKNQSQAQTIQQSKQSRVKIPILSRDIRNIQKFVRQPIPKGKILQSVLKRNKKCGKLCYIDYDLQTEQGKYLVSCKKMAFNICSTYNISLLNGQFQDLSINSNFIGQVKGNFVGSIFNVFKKKENSELKRQLQGSIYYKFDLSCCQAKTRQVQVYIKSSTISDEQLQGYKPNQYNNLKELYEIDSNRQLHKITKFVNKQPKWNPQQQIYTMNFHGKSRYASVKNMIIVNEQNSQQVLLIAKTGTNDFALDFSYPFSPLLALGIVITGFDFKLASQ